MISWIIFVGTIVGFIWLFYTILNDGWGGIDWLALAMSGFVGIFIGGIVGLLLTIMVSNMVTSGADITPKVSKEMQLYAIDDRVGMQGNFFLGTGSVGDKLKYYYATKDDVGLIQIKSLENNDTVYIVEDGEKKITYYEYEFNNKFLRKNFICFGEKTVIHVPKGSVTTITNIDLK